MMAKMEFIVVFVCGMMSLTTALTCPYHMIGLHKCNCTGTPITNVVCTDLNHVNHSALQSLRQTPDIETLEYTGNNIRELEKNIFGECKDTSLDKLIHIDLSNNHIQIIHGQSFHCVPNVRKLILSYNMWQVDINKVRVFSSMPRLAHLELHSTFDLNLDHEIHIKEMFAGSTMTALTDLHLEENGIQSIDKRSFCSLPNLDELYLSSNRLTHVNFDCLTSLHHLYANNNLITTITQEDLESLESKHVLSIVELSDNPFQCNDCLGQTTIFRNWLEDQSKFVVEKFRLTCNAPESLKNRRITTLTDDELASTCAALTKKKKSNKTQIITAVILSIIAVLSAIFIYVNRRSIKKATSKWVQPIRTSTFAKRLHFGYTTMDNNDNDTGAVIRHTSDMEHDELDSDTEIPDSYTSNDGTVAV